MAAELPLQGEGHGQSEQRQGHADGVARGQNAKEHVRDKQQKVVQYVGECGANEDGQCDNACLFIRVHVSSVVAVKDSLRSEEHTSELQSR